MSTLQVSIQGKWTTVPKLTIVPYTLFVTGRRFLIASVFEEEYLETPFENPACVIEGLRKHTDLGRRIDVFTFTQRIPDTSPRHSYRMDFDSIAVVRTDSFKRWWDGLPTESRKNVRLSQKRGVSIAVKQLDDALIRGIMGVNNESDVRQRKHFVHYGKTFEQVKYDQSSFSGRSDFICGYIENELAGFLKVAYSGNVAWIIQILTMTKYRYNKVSNALLARAVELCESKGISYLTYGKFNYGNKSESSLKEFKLRNGFEEMLIPRFYVPLTTKGAVWVKFKLHRGLIGVLPPRMISAAVSLRARVREITRGVTRPLNRLTGRSHQGTTRT